MSVDTITKPGTGSTVKAFPKAAVEAKLKEALLGAAEADAALKGTVLPADVAGKASASVELDSLEVVSLLCDIEPIVGFELKDSLVRRGGYSSVNDALGHLLPRIEKAWEKHGIKGHKK
jgi:hypothetical protein